MRHMFRMALASTLILGCGSCNGDPVTITKPLEQAHHGTVTATVDGDVSNLYVWTVTRWEGFGQFTIVARDSYWSYEERLSISIHVSVTDTTDGVVTASFGEVPGSPRIYNARAFVYAPSNYWGTILDGGGGTLTITSQTRARVSGTFAFTAGPASTNFWQDTLRVTSGTFDVAFWDP